MATTSAKPRSGQGAKRSAKRRHTKPSRTPKPSTPAKDIVSKAAQSAALVVSEGPPTPTRMARVIVRRAAEHAVRRALRSGAEISHRAGEMTRGSHSSVLTAVVHRELPIQQSVDVAVPLAVAFDEWISLQWLPEGVHRVEQISRNGDGRLRGRTNHGGADWEAVVTEERDCESFAWRSVKGSDCAGVATFHGLSERLTRIELNLDVVPINVSDALALSSHLADRHAKADLRRFKARLELISPDVYQDEPADDGTARR